MSDPAPDAVRELAFQWLDAQLGAIEGVLEYERMPSSDPASFPALQLYDPGQRTTEGETEASEYELGFTVEGYVEGSGGADAHKTLNVLYAAVVRAVMPDPPLGGLATTVTEGAMSVDIAKLASGRRLGFAIDFSATIATRRGDPAQPA